ncbi:MAG: F0F1 ATP synthase subunit B [Lachnospirales bacterium]
MNTLNMATIVASDFDRIIGFDKELVLQLIPQWISTAVVIFILGKLLYNPVKDFLRKREEKIAGNLGAAQKSLDDANALKSEYEEKLKNIDIEKADILEKARKIASDKEKEVLQQAHDEANTVKNRALLDIKREEDKARDSMKSSIIEISTLMASRYVATSLSDEDQNKLLDEVIESLGEVKWQN